MIVGDPSKWTACFKSVDDQLLERIVALWPKCLALLSGQPKEDLITINLKELLLKDEVVRSIVYWIEYQFEPTTYTPEGVAYSKGQIDMCVLLQQNSSIYLAYECKRLNVVYKRTKRSMATEYVAEGLMRFVKGQYAEELEVGGMLGYVMDGDCESAKKSVRAAIQASTAAALSGKLQALATMGKVVRFSSNHTKTTSATKIQVRHALLPF